MEAKPKKGTGIYTFLDASGILSRGGTHEEFNRLKKQYWAEYRRQWKKNKRKQSKSFEILFNPKEMKIILSQATKQQMSPTSFIKQSALSKKQHIMSPVIKGEIRKLWLQHYRVLQNMTEENVIPNERGKELLEQLRKIEEQVLSAFNN